MKTLNEPVVPILFNLVNPVYFLFVFLREPSCGFVEDSI